MDFDFKKAMSEQTDEELVKIITVDRNKYQPSAIETAEKEIKSRNIDITIIEQLKENIATEKTGKEALESKKAGSLMRFVHLIIDSIIWLIIAAVLTFPLNADNSFQMLIGYLIMLGSFIGYYYLMEAKYQKTVAKFITKTKVVINNGDKPKKGDVLRRTLCRLIPFDGISYLFTKNGLHDRLSDTTLIKDSK